jgi:hypothetical protein
MIMRVIVLGYIWRRLLYLINKMTSRFTSPVTGMISTLSYDNQGDSPDSCRTVAIVSFFISFP